VSSVCSCAGVRCFVVMRAEIGTASHLGSHAGESGLTKKSIRDKLLVVARMLTQVWLSQTNIRQRGARMLVAISRMVSKHGFARLSPDRFNRTRLLCLALLMPTTTICLMLRSNFRRRAVQCLPLSRLCRQIDRFRRRCHRQVYWKIRKP